MDDDLKGDTESVKSSEDYISPRDKHRKKSEEMAASVKEIATNSGKLNGEMYRARALMESQYSALNANLDKVNSEMKRVNDALILKMKFEAALRAGNNELADNYLQLMVAN